MINFNELKKPFPISALKWRIGTKSKDGTKAKMLVYIDARDVQDRLDEVVGPENWQFETRSMESMCRTGKTITIVGRLGIRINDNWIWKEDGAENSDIEAAKGGISDSMKRAAVQWGIGRYLYDASEFDTFVNYTTDFNTYKDNKKVLDEVAVKLTLKAHDDLGTMEGFILSLTKPSQVKYIANINQEMFGDKYNELAKTLLDKMEE